MGRIRPWAEHAGLVEHREPDARGLGAKTEIVALEDARADGLDLLNQAVDRVVASSTASLSEGPRGGNRGPSGTTRQADTRDISQDWGRSAPRGSVPVTSKTQKVSTGNAPFRPRSISSAIGPATRCQVDVMSTLACIRAFPSPCPWRPRGCPARSRRPRRASGSARAGRGPKSGWPPGARHCCRYDKVTSFLSKRARVSASDPK